MAPAYPGATSARVTIAFSYRGPNPAASPDPVIVDVDESITIDCKSCHYILANRASAVSVAVMT